MKLLLITCLLVLAVHSQFSGCFVLNTIEFDTQQFKYPVCFADMSELLCFHLYPRVYVFKYPFDADKGCPFPTIRNIERLDAIRSNMDVVRNEVNE